MVNIQKKTSVKENKIDFQGVKSFSITRLNVDHKLTDGNSMFLVILLLRANIWTHTQANILANK